MGERKVLNKYYPPDFDPSLIPRIRRQKNQQITVRMMLPMNVQCTSCGEFMYAGKKFNSKKECALGEDYLGILVWRFYIKCTMCASEITFKTDPKNGDYTCERGATRNFEPWKEHDKDVEEAKQEREDEERGDAMKALENRQLESRREMQQMEDLEDLLEISAGHARIDANSLIARHAKQQNLLNEKKEKEDEQRVRALFGTNEPEDHAASGMKIKRVADIEDDDDIEITKSDISANTPDLSALNTGLAPVKETKTPLLKRLNVVLKPKRQRPEPVPNQSEASKSRKTTNSNSSSKQQATNSLLSAYDSSESD